MPGVRGEAGVHGILVNPIENPITWLVWMDINFSHSIRSIIISSVTHVDIGMHGYQ